MTTTDRLRTTVGQISPKGRREAIVIGGSLSGYFAAIVLKRHGYSVRVFERSPASNLRAQGAGLGIRGACIEFIKRYDRIRKPFTMPGKAICVLDEYGNEIFRRETPSLYTSWTLLHQTLRANFEDSAQDGEGEGTSQFESNVIGVEEFQGRIRVQREIQGKRDTAMADLVIAADGPSSTLREILLPEAQKTYAGYVVWRGTVDLNALSAPVKDLFQDAGCIYFGEGNQMLSYNIPSEDGSLDPRDWAVNWAWYRHCDTTELQKVLTDADGRKHRASVPMGKLSPEIVQQLKHSATQLLPPPYQELVSKTDLPFVQVITDVIATKNVFFDGKVLLLGDAVAGNRPHLAASTSQGAFHAMKLEDMLKGEITTVQWEAETMGYSRAMNEGSIELGHYLMEENGLPALAKLRKQGVLMAKAVGDELLLRRYSS